MSTNPAGGTITILFTDVEGSTDLRTRIGDDEAHAILRAHEELVRQQIDAYGGREVKSLGDGFMAAFVSARNAIRSAVAIQQVFEGEDSKGLRVRIGLNTGEAIEEAGDLYGQAVNAAARIAAQASGGEILVAPVVKDLAGIMPDAAFVDRGLFWLKGFPERWRLHEVRWTGVEAPSVPVWIGSQRTPFVGREEERAEMRRHIDEALAGHGSLVLISGEPGLGKTRLAEEMADEATRRGMLALMGRCYETESPPPFMPLVEVLQTAAEVIPPEVFREALGDTAGEVARLLPELRRLFPDIPPAVELPPEQERRYLLNSLRDFIERTSRRRPLCLILDDAHWADESTILSLQHTTERLGQMPALIIGTYRDVELDVTRPLARVLPSLFRQPHVRRLSLRRLPEEGVEDMLAALAGHAPPPALVKVIYAETEGNPFFVEEVFRHFVEEGRLLDEAGRFRSDLVIDELDVPEGVRLVIGRRLERLGERGRKVLAGAAVIGRDFDFGLLEAVNEGEGDDVLQVVEEAEQASLVTVAADGRSPRFRFAHELIRQTLLAGLSMPRRQRLHLKVADALERVYARALDEHAAELAHHLYQAGAAADQEKTVRYLRAAAERALDAAAFEDALRLLENALALDATPDPGDRAGLLHQLGLAHRSLGHWDQALELWREALGLLESAGEAERAGEVAAAAVQQLLWANRMVEALEMAGRGLAALGDRAIPEAARLMAAAGVSFAIGGEYDAAAELMGRSLALAEQLGHDRLFGYALYALTILHWCYQDHRDAIETGERAAETLRGVGDLWDLAALWGFMANSSFLKGEFDSALPLADEAWDMAQRIGHHGALLLPGRSRAVIDYVRTGDIDGFDRYLGTDLEICLALGSPFERDAYAWRGHLVQLRGNWDEALEWFEKGAEVRIAGVWGPVHGALLALHCARLGMRDRALALLEERWGDLPVSGRKNHFGAWCTLALAVQTLVELGQRERAGELYPLMQEHLATGTVLQIYDFHPVATTAGIAATAARRFDDAVRHLDQALLTALGHGSAVHAADARLLLGRALMERDGPSDRDRASEALRLAAEAYRSFGMPKLLEQSEALLADA